MQYRGSARVWCGWVALGALTVWTGLAEEWTRFRGPNGSGVTTSTGFPTEFGPQKNVVWRSPVRPGKSSPVLTDSLVYLTGIDKGRLYTQCFGRATGALLWERFVERARAEDAHSLNDAAASTPVTDGQNVYVLFRDYGLVSYDSKGKQRWKVPLDRFTNAMGLAVSPIIAGGALVLQADQQERSYIAAFDLASGEPRWKAPREENESWATPLIYHPRGGPAQIITAGDRRMGGHAVDTGKRAWSQMGMSVAVVASPVLSGDTVYAFGYGYDTFMPFSEALEKYDTNKDGRIDPDEAVQHAWLMKVAKYDGNRDGTITEDEWTASWKAIMVPSSLVAIRLEPDADGTNGNAVKTRQLWSYERSFIGVVPSPLVYQNVLYVMKNGGILTSFDPETGKVLKAGRLEEAIGGYSASPVAAEGRIYLASEDGKMVVVRAGNPWSVITVNDLGAPCFATPALSSGRIYVRTESHLFCFATRS